MADAGSVVFFIYSPQSFLNLFMSKPMNKCYKNFRETSAHSRHVDLLRDRWLWREELRINLNLNSALYLAKFYLFCAVQFCSNTKVVLKDEC